MKLKSLTKLMFTACFIVVSAGYVLAKPVVFVSILPQKYFVQQISGDKLQVEVMVKPGASPATYEPKPSQMKMLSESDIYFAIGVPFEHSWMSRIAGVNRDMKIVHTDKGIEKIMMIEDAHENRGENDHDHSGYDPHIWLSPMLVAKQAAVIADTLSVYYPESALFFKKNYLKFIKEIELLDAELRQLLQERTGVQFMVFHPSWGYFAHDYGLKQVAIEIEGKKPKSSQLRKLIKYAREHDVRFIFAQPQFSRKSAEVIAEEIDGEVIFIDPLAEDWLENMKEVASKIKNTTEKQKTL